MVKTLAQSEYWLVKKSQRLRSSKYISRLYLFVPIDNPKSVFMSLTLRTDFGCTEAIIDDDCGLKRFYEVANILSDDLEIRFTNKEDDFDTLTWDFLYRGHILTLHYNIYTGISIYPRKFREAPRKDNDAVIEVAKFLEKKLLIHSVKKYMS